MGDLTTEYEIRGIEYPGKEISSDLEVVTQAARASFATWEDERKRELGEAIVGCFEAARTRKQ